MRLYLWLQCIFMFHFTVVEQTEGEPTAAEQIARQRSVNYGREVKMKLDVEKDWKERVLYSSPTFTDARWPDQWYLMSDGVSMNVKEVWKKRITGNGVVVGVIDNGIETNHPELAQAYDSRASLNIVGNTGSPYRHRASHGTKCAGVIAARANNGICGVGVAHGARVGDIRLIRDTKATDYMEARALSHQRDYIDIYSNSWGPGDAGWQVEGPGALTRKAFEDGVSKGRRNRGSIFVFAAGNGGAFGDMCGYNGYVNRIETITVSGVNWDGHVPIYAEACAGIMAVSFSRDAFNDFSQVVTSAKGRRCTGGFSSTSAAAAMATGTIALLLEANPSLTWRDVQHIVIRSARPTEPTRRRSSRKLNRWKKNKAGLMVSDYFGFGLIDTSKMVQYAAKWQRVPRQLKCEIYLNGSWNTDARGSLTRSFHFNWVAPNTQHCSRINYLEHVLVEVDLTYSRRGDLEMELQSAQRTTSTLLSHRPMDTISRRRDLRGWTVKSLHFWGENPSGIWTLMMRNAVPRRRNRGTLFYWKLILYGSVSDPLHRNPFVAKEKRKALISRTAPDCQDSSDDCQRRGCNRWNYGYYTRNTCKRSCGRCGSRATLLVCRDSSWSCSGWIQRYSCRDRRVYNQCRKSCGACSTRQRPSVCRDSSWSCSSWIQRYSCRDRRVYDQCPKSCGACSTRQRPSVCRDSSSLCPTWVAKVTCSFVPTRKSCPRTCGACPVQTASGRTGR